MLFDLIADQPGRPYEQVTSWTAHPGGAPANVACGLVKLGTPAAFMGCIGEDEAGMELLTLLQKTGVDWSGVQRHLAAPTRKIYVTRSETGDRQFAGFGDRDTSEFADTRLQADRLPVDLFATADYLVLGTLELPYPLTRAAVYRALELADQHNVKIFVDVNWRPMFWPNPDKARPMIYDLVKRIDYLKLSAEEAEWLFDTKDPGAITHRVGELEGVLVTDGDCGSAYCLGETEGKLPAFEMEVEDTTGAGDGFVAGFLHQLCLCGIHVLEDAEVAREVMTYATAVGALTTTRSGAIAAQPTAAEVEAFLYMHKLQD
jgi:fructokinase